ncbi:MAG: DUF3098 domain-containing protein [Bacteroidetes bacterium]|nr:DUF3098 domain-containing protein [Bacteroidota bacterium]
MNKQVAGRIKEQVQDTRFAVSRKNVVWILAGFGLMVLGYLLMTGGGTKDPHVFTGVQMFSFRRIVLAPLLIFAGFVFEIWAIMHKKSAE